MLTLMVPERFPSSCCMSLNPRYLPSIVHDGVVVVGGAQVVCVDLPEVVFLSYRRGSGKGRETVTLGHFHIKAPFLAKVAAGNAGAALVVTTHPRTEKLIKESWAH